MGKGWIKLHRKIQDHEFYPTNEKRPFTYLEAWIDLLLNANHAPKIVYGKTVQRTVQLTSEIKLAARWGWSRGKVRRYLRTLNDTTMITTNSTTNDTTITIVNYDFYQGEGPTDDTTDDTTNGTTNGTTSEQQTVHKQEEKNLKKKRNKICIPKRVYAPMVQLTEQQYDQLKAQYGEEAVQQMIQVLSNYKQANNKHYASDYHAILNWVVEKVVNKNGGRRTTPGNPGESKGQVGGKPEFEYDFSKFYYRDDEPTS